MMAVAKERNPPCKNWPFRPRQTVRSTWFVSTLLQVARTPTDLDVKVAVARSDGSTSISRLQARGLETVREWSEPRLKAGQRFVGLAASSACVRVFSSDHA